jgi:hypothetical protein
MIHRVASRGLTFAAASAHFPLAHAGRWGRAAVVLHRSACHVLYTGRRSLVVSRTCCHALPMPKYVAGSGWWCRVGSKKKEQSFFGWKAAGVGYDSWRRDFVQHVSQCQEYRSRMQQAADSVYSPRHQRTRKCAAGADVSLDRFSFCKTNW